MKKPKKTYPPRECERCKQMFLPEDFKTKVCSMDCAKSKWAEAVAKARGTTWSDE